MRLYKYVDRDAYEALLEHGRLTGSRAHSPFPEFAKAYGWLSGVMADRIGPAPEGAPSDWPVFAWHTHDGMGPLAYDRGGSEDTSHILLGFDVPDDRVLLSDFDDWHYVLNGWYLPMEGSASESEANNADIDRFEVLEAAVPEGVVSVDLERERRKHWRRICERPFENGSVQATLWEVRLEWVFYVKVRHAEGLGPPSMALLSRKAG